jgi:hypothetical protein
MSARTNWLVSVVNHAGSYVRPKKEISEIVSHGRMPVLLIGLLQSVLNELAGVAQQTLA